MSGLTEVPIGAAPPSRFATVLAHRYEALAAEILRAVEVMRGRVVWHINSTAAGGGVAEMLHSHLAYARGAGVDVRWLVLGGDSEFFTVTKRIHNRLHEHRGDEHPLDAPGPREIYDRTLAGVAPELTALVSPGDIVFLHDPQPVGLVHPLKELGAQVVWRCHVGVDRPGPNAREAWRFLLPHVKEADVLVFSRPEYIWEGLDGENVQIVPPTIDAFSPKNQELDPPTVAAMLAVCGVAVNGGGEVPVFTRADGSPGRVSRAARLVSAGPLPADARVVTQVSRWDRLKDPLGLVRCFAEHVTDRDAHMLLAGPDVEAVTDDPEGAEVLAEVTTLREGLAEDIRARVHLISLPMDDLEENAAMVNALQRRSDVIVQKSLAEGFGLTVAEAMWKSKPVVAGRVGGIQDQIVDGESGILVEDPADLAAVGAAIDSLLADSELAQRIGAAARDRVADNFLAIDRMLDYFRILEALMGEPVS